MCSIISEEGLVRLEKLGSEGSVMMGSEGEMMGSEGEMLGSEVWFSEVVDIGSERIGLKGSVPEAMVSEMYVVEVGV